MRGKDGDYEWADRLGDLWEHVERSPEIVIGRRVVVSAFDSGSLTIARDEESRGWKQVGSVVVTAPVTSLDELAGALTAEGGEAWTFDAAEPVPDFAGWEHLGGQLGIITLAEPGLEFPDPPPGGDMELVAGRRTWLDTCQERIRDGLRRFRPLTFLRDDLIVTRDPVAIAALDALFADASRCRCQAHGNESWAEPNLPLFTAPFSLLESSVEAAADLHRCRACGAQWLVEHGWGQPLALRLASRHDWKETDRWPARRKLVVRDHGGEEENACAWAGCERRALRGIRICAEHLHPAASGTSTSGKR